MRLKVFLLIHLLGILCLAMTETTDYSLGIAALERGDLRTAKAKLTLCYKQNPTDPAVQLAFASISSCSTAVSIYKSVGEQSTVPDTLRGSAYKKLGDYYYVSKEYLRAIESYRYALKYGKRAEYRHYWALSALASGDEESARSIWHTLTLEYGDTLSEIAQYHLGLLDLKLKKYQDALNSFSKAGIPAANHPWAVAAIPGKIECAQKLGLSEKATQYEKQLDPYRDLMMEINYTNTAKLLPGQKVAESSTIAKITPLDTAFEKPDSLKLFTLQVGAFGSKENAQALEQKIKNQFSGVSIVQLIIDDKTFYRVWVGTFKSKSAAEMFGTDSLSKQGLSFRVVER
jgi:tetratricopeptide (TPR) repeat protein